MTQTDVITYFNEEFPLIKIFDFDNVSKLFYDARANMMFIVDNSDLTIMIEYIKNKDKNLLTQSFPNINNIDKITNTIDTLQDKGVLIPGPAKQLISTTPQDVEARINYNMKNIFMRKFVLETTQQCNFRCRYCHNTLEPVFRHHTKKQMTFSVAKAAIDFYKDLYLKFYNKLPQDKKSLLLKHYPPFIGFYGGEPSLNWSLVEKATDYYLNSNWEESGIVHDKLTFSINTNLYYLTDEMMSFIMKYHPLLFVSLDGSKDDNDRNRVTADGKGTFDKVFSNLQRIKNADPEYFKEKILILCVEADGNDLKAVHKFLDSLECPKDYLSMQPYGCLESNPEKQILFYENEEQNLISSIIEKYIKRLSDNDPDAIDEFTSLYFLENVKYSAPKIRRHLSISLTCPLCIDNIMIGTDGEMHICHKTDGSLPLGNVCNGGYDMQKMFEAYKNYGDTTNCEECCNCWAMNACNYCAALRLKGGKFINPMHSECNLQRRRVEYLIKLFIAAYKIDPNILPKLMERKHDLEHYKSIVDFNEFIKKKEN